MTENKDTGEHLKPGEKSPVPSPAKKRRGISFSFSFTLTLSFILITTVWLFLGKGTLVVKIRDWLEVTFIPSTSVSQTTAQLTESPTTTTILPQTTATQPTTTMPIINPADVKVQYYRVKSVNNQLVLDGEGVRLELLDKAPISGQGSDKVSFKAGDNFALVISGVDEAYVESIELEWLYLSGNTYKSAAESGRKEEMRSFFGTNRIHRVAMPFDKTGDGKYYKHGVFKMTFPQGDEDGIDRWVKMNPN